MSEMAKTGLFVGVAVLALALALFSRPTPPPIDGDGLVSSKNLNVLDDPLAAQELEIIRWDPTLGDATPFKVARLDGVWTIPSHENYPADAERQMGDAATAATNLKPLGIASTKSADHETYGVVDPEGAKPGMSGVGDRVVMKDGKGETLVSTIIGKEVKGQAGQRYVRQVGKDPVYIVKMDPSKLSTKFEDWIEKDLLKINTLDIAKVKINDYSVKLAATQGGIGLIDNRRGEIELAYDDAKSVWSLEKLLKWDEQTREMVPDEMPAGKELNNTRLNDMKSALGDLKIIDVQRKPAGMNAELKLTSDDVSNNQQMRDLMKRGFYAVGVENGAMELLSSEGDFVVEQKDGVQYVLRFGGIKLGSGNSEEPVVDGAEGEQSAEPKGENRYLFVAARYNPNAIPVPVRPEILGPEEPAGDEPADEAAPADPAAEKPADEAEPAEAKEADTEPAAPSDDAAPAKEASEEKPAEATPEENVQLTLDQEDGAAVDQATPAEKAEPAVEKQAAEPATEPAEPAPAAEEKPADPAVAPAADDQQPDAKAAENAPAEEAAPAKEAVPAVKPDDAAAQRAAAEMKYNREMDEYNDKVQKAQDRVKELNTRFGDWYYVISNEVFQKIHVTRENLFVAKAGEKQAAEEAPPTSIPLNAPGSIQE